MAGEPVADPRCPQPTGGSALLGGSLVWTRCCRHGAGTGAAGEQRGANTAAWMRPWASSCVGDALMQKPKEQHLLRGLLKPCFSLSSRERLCSSPPSLVVCTSASKPWDFCSSLGRERCAVPRNKGEELTLASASKKQKERR